jgi:AMP deaminase
MHEIFNKVNEAQEQRNIKFKDFNNVFKVDNHIHLSAAMNAKHLLQFIKSKLSKEANTKVMKKKDGKIVTLKELFDEIGVKSNELNLNTLDV